MKTFLILGLILSARTAFAQQGIQVVHEVALSSATVFSVGVASQPSVEVTSITANGIMYGAFSVELFNPSSSTNTVNCGFDANVSTRIASPAYGREIAPGTGIVYQFLQRVVKIFCMSQSVVGATSLTVTQAR